MTYQTLWLRVPALSYRVWWEPSRRLRSRLGERSPLEDETLIAAAQQGDDAAFEELVRRYQEAACRAGFLVLRDASPAPSCHIRVARMRRRSSDGGPAICEGIANG